MFDLTVWTLKSDPAELLRKHGLSITAQRLAVLRALSRRPHSTADAIAEEVRAEIEVISRQAVYNALGTLAEKGLIRRIQPFGSPALYEDRVGDNHHHAICRTCGKTVDVNCAVGAAPCLTAAAAAGFQIDEAEVVYWGTCPECLAKRSEAGGQRRTKRNNNQTKPRNQINQPAVPAYDKPRIRSRNRKEAPRE